MSGSVFLYLVTRGRTSGLPRKIEIWFVEHEGRFYLVAEQRERANWVRNILADSAVQLSVGDRGDRQCVVAQCPARGRVLDERADATLLSAVRARMETKYDWSDGLVVELAPEG